MNRRGFIELAGLGLASGFFGPTGRRATELPSAQSSTPIPRLEDAPDGNPSRTILTDANPAVNYRGNSLRAQRSSLSRQRGRPSGTRHPSDSLHRSKDCCRTARCQRAIHTGLTGSLQYEKRHQSPKPSFAIRYQRDLPAPEPGRRDICRHATN